MRFDFFKIKYEPYFYAFGYTEKNKEKENFFSLKIYTN